MGKHTDPIPNILSKLVKYNPRAEDDEEDYIFPDELNKLVRFVGKTEGVNITGLNDKGLIKNNVLLGAIRREFNLDADYKTKAKGFTNKSTNKTEYVRVYPNLCKTDKYEEYLKQMKDEANQ